jgi:hypothetical protein
MPAASRFALRPRSAHEPEPDLTRLVVAHRAICQDLDRLVTRLGADFERSIPRAGSLRRYTAAVLAQVRAHNDGEVDILWPVAAAAAGQAVDIAPLTDDRHAVVAALTQADQALAAAWAGPGALAGLQASLRQLRDLLDEHIADEEQQMFPAIRRYLRADAYRWCQKQMQRNASVAVRRFAVPWLARHARHDELRSLRATCGWPDRILLVCSGAGYARLERHALNTGPLAPTARQRPHPESGKKAGEEMIEHQTDTGQRPDTLQPAAPLAVRNAALVMYAGAVACVIRTVVALVTSGATKTAIEHKYPRLSASGINTVTHITVISEAVAALIGAVLFIWIARACLQGKNWARITGTVFCALGLLGILTASLGVGSGRTAANLIMTCVVAGIGLISICLLWQRGSNAYFRRFGRPTP